MTKFLAVCSSGLGSSFMVQMNIEKLLREQGVSGVEVDHADLGSVAPGDADAYFVGADIAEGAGHLGNVVVLDSIIDMNELRDKVAGEITRLGLGA